MAPAIVELTPASWKPNGELAFSWLTDTVDPESVGAFSRPRPLLPWSACSRAAITWVRPACEPLPLRMASVDATDGSFTALPENR